ncbi:MAG: acyl-CoA dehydrogenase family protein [Oligoflexia bacterium]|nr:acyl-CoA dehydrogenase family protein [Oligoflexia bacterium]MBF0364263.1 acyl-CoA dehydrogenase family protein [Oligoflexia bacterium]
MNYYQDSSEWQYLFKNGVDWDKIIELYYPSSPRYPTSEGFQNKEEVIAFYEELLSSIADWTANSLAAKAKALDHEGAGKIVNNTTQPGATLQEVYNEAKQLGVFGLPLTQEYGGVGAPITLGLFSLAFISRACLSSSAQIGFFSTIADMIERFGSKEHKEKYIQKIINGEISGSMCLTEPDAGSDVGAIRTEAVKMEDGSYRLTGSKCFITNAGGGLAFILARTKGAPEGLKGISLFFAEEWLDDEKGGAPIHNYKITKIEEKMGLHGSFTCEVVYENTKAYLVGEENKGIDLMFYLMNEARIAVGVQSLGAIEAAISKATEYAKTRYQFGKPIIEHALLAKHFKDMEVEQNAIRALLIDTIYNFDIFQKLSLKKREHPHDSLSPEENELFKKISRIVRKRTPLVKYYGSESCSSITKKAIQMLGGYGFMKEYELERIHRDSFALLIYEGTSQIQSLMAVKDLIKYIMQRPLDYILSMLKKDKLPAINIKWSSSDTERDTEAPNKIFHQVNYQFKIHLIKLIVRSLRPKQLSQLLQASAWKNPESIDRLIIHSETICQALSYTETLRVLSQHASKSAERIALFYQYLRLVSPRLEGIYCSWDQNQD